MDCNLPGSSVHGIFQGLPFPPPGDLPNPGIEPGSPALTGKFSLPTVPAGKPKSELGFINFGLVISPLLS